jgi:hypothetical protein
MNFINSRRRHIAAGTGTAYNQLVRFWTGCHAKDPHSFGSAERRWI